MTSNESFFTRKQAAAVLKHGVLSRYPRVFASMAGKGQSEVVLFDGYAGPGRYDDGSPGSPLLAVEAARSTSSFRNVRCVFCEGDIDSASNLESVLREEAGEGLLWEVLIGDVQRYAATVVQEAGSAPMLTFLDPFGIGLPYIVLTETLLARPTSCPTEVLLNINVESVGRIGGRLRERPGARTQGAEATLRRVDTFMGGDWWRDEFNHVRDNKTGTAAAAAEHIVRDFCGRVKAATGFDSFQVPIRRRPTHPPLFMLTLFFRHRVAPWKFNESASSANADWRRACVEADLERKLSTPVEASLFGDASETEAMIREADISAWERQEKTLHSEWVETITHNLRGLLASSSSVDPARQVREVYGSTLGLARDMHVSRAWGGLAEEGVAAPRVKGLSLERQTIHRL